MAEAVNFEIRIAATQGNTQKNLSIAELGALLTGINRAINKAVANASSLPLGYFPPAHEPTVVNSEIVRVGNGSIVLTITSTVREFFDSNILQATFLAGIVGSAAWDFTKLLSKEATRALRRVNRSARTDSEYVRVEPTFDEDRRVLPSPLQLPSQQTSEVVDDETGEMGNQRTATAPIIYAVSIYTKGERVIEVRLTSEQRFGG